MEQPWYCRVGDEQRGPFTFQQLKRAAARGELKLTSLVRRADIASWTEAGQIPDLWPRAAAIPPEDPPVGAPVVPLRAVGPASPQSVPVRPLATPPQPPPPPVFAAPLTAPATRPHPVAPHAAAPATPAGATAKPLSPAERRQQARRKMLLLVGGSAGALVLVVLVVLVVNSMTGSKEQAAVSTPAATAAMPLATDIPDTPAGSPPAAAAAAAAPPPAPMTAAAAVAPGGGAPPAAAVPAASAASPEAAAIKQIVQSTRPWRNIQSSPGVSSRSARLQIVGVWFAPRKPKQPADAGAAAADAPAEGVAEAAAPTLPATATAEPKVICVELRVSNLDRNDAPLTFSSWNMPPGKPGQPAAVCVDSQDQPLAMVPADAYPDPLRQTKPLRIAPKQAASDLLVFEAPTGDFEDLRLGLRATAINAGEIYLGFRIPKESILAEKPVELAGGAAPAPTADARAAVGDATDDMPAQPSAAAAAPMPREETIDDLRRQIAETAKARKEEKDAEYKKQDAEREQEMKKEMEQEAAKGKKQDKAKGQP